MDSPGVVTWFKVYAFVMLLVYGAVCVLGLWMFNDPNALVDPNAGIGSNQPSSVDEAKIMGVVYAGLGAVFGLAFLVGLFTPQRFWAWIYNLVLICLGLTSICCLPITIPLLIFWIKADVRAWYRNQPIEMPQPGLGSHDRPQF